MDFFDKERKKKRKKVFFINIVDKIVNKSFENFLSQKFKKLILVVDISPTLLECPHFEIMLKSARSNKSPCFFIVDNRITLPVDWNRGLNILFLDYYSNKNEYMDLEVKAMESAYKYSDTGEI